MSSASDKKCFLLPFVEWDRRTMSVLGPGVDWRSGIAIELIEVAVGQRNESAQRRATSHHVIKLYPKLALPVVTNKDHCRLFVPTRPMLFHMPGMGINGN